LFNRLGPSAVFPYEQERLLLQNYFDHVTSGYFVEVGANDPERDSQTWRLEQRGWTGVLIEPLPELAARLRERRRSLVYEIACSSPHNSGKTMRLRMAGLQMAGTHSSLDPDFFVPGTSNSGEIEVKAMTLDEILFEAQAPHPIDFLSIDVEGHETEVLAGVTLSHWRPRLILIEDHAKNLRIHRALTSRGYRWVRRTGLNGWYVPEDSPERVGVLGNWQFFRKHYLGVPFRRIRDFKRKVRQRIGERPLGHP
jgi:FkbM family methyltransferase